MLEAPTSVSSLKNTTHRRLPVGSLVRPRIPTRTLRDTTPYGAACTPPHLRTKSGRDCYFAGFRVRHDLQALCHIVYSPVFPRSTPVPLHSNPESIEYGVRNGDRRRDGPARGASPDAEVLVRRSRRLRRKSILDARVRPRERHAPHTRRRSEHPDRPVDQHLPGDDHGGPADDAEDQDRVHHGTQVLGRGVHGQADRRRHGRRALQLLARVTRGSPGGAGSLP